MEKKKFDEKRLLQGIMLEQKEIITSRQNPTVKRICSLNDKKGRRNERLFRFDGIKLFGEALNKRIDVRYAVVCTDAPSTVKSAVEDAVKSKRLSPESVIAVSAEVFEKISEEKSPEGIVTVASFIPSKHRSLSNEDATHYCVDGNERLLIAESLRDPGNLGTVIRSCAALGIDRLVISDDCADIYSPKVIRGAMGGLFALPIDIVPAGELASAILSLRASGRRVYAAALHNEALEIGELRLCRGDCFVIGNEGHGLSQRVIDACDACAIIPMTEGSESLNAAAAAAICIWETVKKA